MRLIDADVLRVDYFTPSTTTSAPNFYYVSAKQIESAPTVDAVPVVRCRECKWFADGKWCRNPNNDMVQGGTTGEWFCGDGKRKDGADGE